MKTNTLGSFGPVSRLTLGGGGIGQVWGSTSEDDAVATLRHAVDQGIDLIDAAPGYKICEAMIGRAFEGRLPAGVRVTTKYSLGTVPAAEVYDRFRTSLQASLRAMRLERVDMFLLHSEIRPDDFEYPAGQPPRDERSTALSLYREAVRPAFARLVQDGLIGHWGITGINHAAATIDALADAPRPAAVQAIANLLDSPGEMNGTGLAPRPRDVIAAARAAGVGVMGVRAVQAGALTNAIDRIEDSPTSADFERAAPYRDLCRAWGEDPAIIAHRYALGIEGVDTLVLGVKNVAELDQALEAERRGPLDPAQLAAIEALGLR
ncbi:MAG: aldo/keto reductase [Alphaproteobacteria bacterium]|nr:aldo/keto reductase [Alphaproteobacteria bacterium]MBU1562201.1 aldo/keto reductase [Alphaproteobacteria bacterium]MBU2302827.1 aldo/keto reductase [Alphaproteobacteria bacterium]MBU2366428.1 aldo/keto reductase [Alphaproteobacteria bacterium]